MVGSGAGAREYAGTWAEFLAWFPDEAACLRYLEAGGDRLPSLRRAARLAHRGRALVGLLRLLEQDVGDGRDDLREDAHAASDLVRRGVVSDQ